MSEAREAVRATAADVPGRPGDALPAGPLPASARPRLSRAKHGRPGLIDEVRAALDNRRLFILLPFAIISGLIAFVATAGEPDPLALAAVALALAVAAVLVRHVLLAMRLAAVAGAFLAGFCLLPIHGALFGTAMLSRPAYGTYEMRVDEIIASAESGRRVIVSDIRAIETARALPIRRGRIVLGEGPDLEAGDIIRAPVRFYAVPGPVIPGGFDTQFHAYFDGIGAYGNATQAFGLVRHGDAAAPERIVGSIRRVIGERIDLALQQPAAGIARALITGDQSQVSNSAREVMASAGLAHVLSVSGLHLTIVAGGVFVALRMLLSLFGGLGRFVSVKRVAAGAGIVAAVLYFSISGGNVAALRATVMILLVFGAVIFGRRALTMRNVAVAALVVLLTDPASVFRPSFQLSFAAVVALIGAWELASSKEGSRERSIVRQAGDYFAGIAATSFVAGAATLLFSVYHFQQTSPLGVLGNLASLPLVGFVMMPAAVLGALAMPLGFEMPFLAAMGWSIDRMLDLAGLVAALSGGLDASPLLTPLALILGLGALAWFAFLTSWHRFIGPVLLVPAVVLFALDRAPDGLIADTVQATALRLEDGLQIVAGKAEGFAVEVWRETYGEPLTTAEVACDSVACVVTSPRGFSAAIVRDPGGFYEECGADLVITRRAAPAWCGAGTVIDAGDLAEGGVHWLAWDAAARRFEVRRAIPDRNRAWRVPL